MQHQENNIAKRRISKQNYKDKLLVVGLQIIDFNFSKFTIE
jgi:hypothetical protein